MKRRRKAYQPPPPPTFKTFRLIVIKYEGVKMFFDPVSKRAALEIRCGNVPYQTTLEWRRHEELLATAKMDIVGNCHDLASAFEGPRPLVKPDNSLRLTALNDYTRRGPRELGNKVSVGTRQILVGDELLVIMPRKYCRIDRKLGVNQWFAEATLLSREAAVDAHNHTRAWRKIDKMIPDVQKRIDFWFKHREKPWKQALRLAKRYATRHPKS